MTGTNEPSSAPPEPRSVEALCEAVAGGWEPQFLFFWGHTPKPRQRHIGAECLSQWYPAEFVVDGTRFATAEHFMMYRKALLFDDPDTATRILAAREPGAAKALGRAVRGFDEDVWKKERVAIVVAASVAKFGQNEALRTYLQNTKRQVLVEASPRDAIWGIGLSVSNPAAQSPWEWRGLNLLGFALMAARSELSVEPAPNAAR